MKDLKMARFDTRLPLEQKEFFEYAASLGGFKTFTEFVTWAVKLQADKIVEKHNAMLASKKDQEIFFDALLDPPAPNESLIQAAERYLKTAEK